MREQFLKHDGEIIRSFDQLCQCISSPEQLMEILCDNNVLNTPFFPNPELDDLGDFYHDYALGMNSNLIRHKKILWPNDVIKHRAGNSLDIAILVHRFLTEKNIKHRMCIDTVLYNEGSKSFSFAYTEYESEVKEFDNDCAAFLYFSYGLGGIAPTNRCKDIAICLSGYKNDPRNTQLIDYHSVIPYVDIDIYFHLNTNIEQYDFLGRYYELYKTLGSIRKSLDIAGIINKLPNSIADAVVLEGFSYKNAIEAKDIANQPIIEIDKEELNKIFDMFF